MGLSTRGLAVLGLLTLAFIQGCTKKDTDAPIDPTVISKELAALGSYSRDSGVFHVETPRPHLNFSIKGVAVSEGATRSWASFTGTQKHAFVIGELPISEDEVNGAVLLTLESGLEVTTLHNTFLWDVPRVMSLHFEGSAPADVLVNAVTAVFTKSAGPLVDNNPLVMPPNADKTDFDLKPIHQYLWQGKYLNGSYQIETGRETTVGGFELGKSMGIKSWLSFTGSNKLAFVNGDISMLEPEMQRVIKRLVEYKFKIVSIHTHLTRERPRIIFVHFIGSGPLEEMSHNLKRTLTEEKNFRGST